MPITDSNGTRGSFKIFGHLEEFQVVIILEIIPVSVVRIAIGSLLYALEYDPILITICVGRRIGAFPACFCFFKEQPRLSDGRYLDPFLSILSHNIYQRTSFPRPASSIRATLWGSLPIESLIKRYYTSRRFCCYPYRRIKRQVRRTKSVDCSFSTRVCICELLSM